MKKKNRMRITSEDYLLFNRKLLREEEMERNDGRWVATTRPHTNKKKYNRKQFKKETKTLLWL